MTRIRFLLLMALICGTTGLAKAYRINVLDPAYTTTPFSSQPFSVSFDACQFGQLGNAQPTAGQFCFTGQNQTSAPLTTLEIVLPNTGALFGQTPVCDVVTGVSLFTGATCGIYGSNQVLFFSGLNISNSNIQFANVFTILIEDLPAGTTAADIPQANGTFPPALVIPTSVPEPGSIVMLSTGLLVGGFFLLKRRGQMPA
jgi:hypothetical protein